MIPLTINQGSLDFTKAISQGYDATGWHIVVKGWHDTKTINEAAADFGLAHGPFKDYLPQMYEDAQSGYWINGNPASPMTFTKTLDELKSQLYGAVTDMLFQDASQTITDESAKDDWGHAKGVTGLTNSVGNPTTEALGVMIDSMGNVHIISVTNNHVVDNAGKYAQEMNSKYAVPDQLTELTSQKQALTTQLAAQKQRLIKLILTCPTPMPRLRLPRMLRLVRKPLRMPLRRMSLTNRQTLIRQLRI